MKIAIIGKMCSGKSTIAKIIMDYDSSYQTFSFGGAVKKYAKEIFNMQGKDRSLLINFANKMREIDKDVWVRPVIEDSSLFDNCIVDDVRYQNEVNALIHDGWKIIQLQVSPDIQKRRIMKTYPDNYQEHLNKVNHLSEQNLFLFPDGYPQLNLITDDEHNKQNIHDVNLLVMKNNVI